MTDNQRDVFDALREHDPASVGNADLDAALRQAVKTRVLAAEYRPRRSNRRMVIVVAALIALLLAVSAAAVILRREPTDPQGIACFQNPDLGSPRWGVGPEQSLHPSECESLWRDGTISNPDFGPRGQVPPLVGCVSASGVLWVFPGDDEQICDGLGLARYAQPTHNDGIELKHQLEDLFPRESCVAISDAEVLIQELLTDRGLDDWSVSVSSPASSERPCASLHLDAAGHVINLVPIPRLSDG